MIPEALRGDTEMRAEKEETNRGWVNEHFTAVDIPAQPLWELSERLCRKLLRMVPQWDKKLGSLHHSCHLSLVQSCSWDFDSLALLGLPQKG